MPHRKTPDSSRLDQIVAGARQTAAQREAGYRERALKIYPWICGRCRREFTQVNLRELTVHHRDHNHDNNPSDGSNWELLCVYCHDNEHSRYLEADAGGSSDAGSLAAATHNPFAALKGMLKK
ncbi:YajD family HNH nuclease [Uliginosibacterium sp. 31-16]|uniref:YajD family HNH nuclease n=1 Tax=Uliginosibacterium sp. 31-16 TaxID=3068315 RepID=UPI00273FC235|nr:YajD family HNH nuclease [Uliginosibacterium sp. 31-16]MDP5238725.1 YajD family HNH nuclease [Uliginosibacterium sp. 31-16]